MQTLRVTYGVILRAKLSESESLHNLYTALRYFALQDV
ncbi:hypothetical protein PALI_a1615 [Pseudoalteromonas aliena SW19]|uniref:Transposase n=1 Tax=Pseudoalteromonas aliena SW19 TaxID=1314866 RepID=A0ABR9DVH2_9GAMM|nr:hypothetical protein [Pseudoalteromonas aliena SW19]